MKFFLTIALSFLLSCYVEAMNDHDATGSISAALNGNKQINILLIARNNGAYGDVIKPLEKLDDYGDLGNTVINSVFQQIKGHLSKTHWNIVVFNEMFFSKSTPLSKNRMEEIKNLFFAEIGSDVELKKRTILCSNFLYTDVVPYDVNIITNAETKMTMDNVVFGKLTSTLLPTYKTSLAGLKATSPTNLNILYNRSFISYNYEDITYYDKSSYCNESNDAIFGTGAYNKNKHVYIIGDSEDHKVHGTDYSKLKDLLIKKISSEVCYDLLAGIRKANTWKNSGEDTILHILSSNSVDAKGSVNFPNNKIVICVDPDGTPFTTGSSLTGVFSKKTNKFNVYKKDVERFYHEDITKGNRYYVTKILTKI